MKEEKIKLEKEKLQLELKTKEENMKLEQQKLLFETIETIVLKRWQ